MNRTYASSLFRQATAALAPTAARPLRCSSSRVAQAQAQIASSFHARRSRMRYSTQSESDLGAAEKKNAEEGNGSAAEKDAAAPPSAEEECQRKLKAKEEEVTDLTSRLRYLQADFLNLQRNAAREKEQTRDFAISRFAGDLLETVDVLALALKSVPPEALADASSSSSSSAGASSSESATSPSSSSSPNNASPTSTPSNTHAPAKSPTEHLRALHHGVEMTHRLLLSTLFKYHVSPFDPTGEEFDPHKHEALYQAPIPNVKAGTVLECQKTGYMIKERVLRAAQVGVAAEGRS